MSLLVGWKAIMKVAGLRDINTVKVWCDKYDFPVVRLGKKPVTTEQEILRWFYEIRKNSPFSNTHKKPLNFLKLPRKKP